jgi:hypothetical protein
MPEFPNDGHVCRPPESNDFRDGCEAEGCWIGTWRNGCEVHYQQIAGDSGVYLRVVDMATGEVLRDDTPWQMEAT